MNLDKMKEKIKKEIIKSGIPLEIFCNDRLLKSHWGVSSNHYFVTPEGGYREIDIISNRGSIYKNQNEEISFHSLLTIECKKNKENPWVFFKEDRSPTLNICSNIENINNYLLNNFNKLVKKHHFNTIKYSARRYIVPFKNENTKESRQIYESFAKLIDHFKNYQEIKKLYNIKRKYIQLCYLTVVFDGLMFMADMSKENITLKEIKHAIVSICQFELSKFNHYSIEVVNKKYFGNYITALTKDHAVMENFLKNVKIQQNRVK